jgi:hypothetical protein
MNDLCALEGTRAAENILDNLQASQPIHKESVSIKAEPPIRYIVPQNIIPGQSSKAILQKLFPLFTLQLEHTLKHKIIEAWSGDEKVWSAKFSRVLANNTISLPVSNFDWNRVDFKKGIILRVRQFNS